VIICSAFTEDLLVPGWDIPSQLSDDLLIRFAISFSDCCFIDYDWPDVLEAKLEMGEGVQVHPENEIRLKAGVNLRNYKLVAFAMVCVCRQVTSGTLLMARSTTRVRLTFDLCNVNHRERRWGPLIGVPIVLLGPELLRIAPMLYSVIFASVAIFILLFMPKGMVSLWDWGFKRIAGRAAPELTK
jgi:hypothetical protein